MAFFGVYQIFSLLLELKIWSLKTAQLSDRITNNYNYFGVISNRYDIRLIF